MPPWACRCRVTVVGQSAGAHLSALALLRQAEREAPRGAVRGDTASVWPVSSLVAFVGVSGVYGPVRTPRPQSQADVCLRAALACACVASDPAGADRPPSLSTRTRPHAAASPPTPALALGLTPSPGSLIPPRRSPPRSSTTFTARASTAR